MTIIREHQEYIQRLALMLDQVNTKEYLSDPLPSSIDEMLIQVAEIYLTITTVEDRELFLTLLYARSAVVLSIFAHRMSMLAVRRRSEILIMHGLIILMLSVTERGEREATMTLSLIYNSSKKLGNAQELFVKAATVAPTIFAANWLLNFSSRMPEDQSIEAMGFKEMEGPHGLIYQFGKQLVPDGWM